MLNRAECTGPGLTACSTLRVIADSKVPDVPRHDAITLELHEGPRKLPHVRSASGARYTDDRMSFWSKGDEALFERQGQPAVHCRVNRARSLAADARARGAD